MKSHETQIEDQCFKRAADRSIVLQTIPKPKDRIDDPYLIKTLLEEIEGITQWMI